MISEHHAPVSDPHVPFRRLRKYMLLCDCEPVVFPNQPVEWWFNAGGCGQLNKRRNLSQKLHSI